MPKGGGPKSRNMGESRQCCALNLNPNMVMLCKCTMFHVIVTKSVFLSQCRATCYNFTLIDTWDLLQCHGLRKAGNMQRQQLLQCTPNEHPPFTMWKIGRFKTHLEKTHKTLQWNTLEIMYEKMPKTTKIIAGINGPNFFRGPGSLVRALVWATSI